MFSSDISSDESTDQECSIFNNDISIDTMTSQDSKESQTEFASVTNTSGNDKNALRKRRILVKSSSSFNNTKRFSNHMKDNKQSSSVGILNGSELVGPLIVLFSS
jgi:hypothetical protein